MSGEEHQRYLGEVEAQGHQALISRFVEGAELYLRGRVDGPRQTGARPCGYLFLSEASFERGHAALAYIDLMNPGQDPQVSFRKWKGELPFTQAQWDALDQDTMQRTMKVEELADDTMSRALALAASAKATFSEVFDTDVDLSSGSPA